MGGCVIGCEWVSNGLEEVHQQFAFPCLQEIQEKKEDVVTWLPPESECTCVSHSAVSVGGCWWVGVSGWVLVGGCWWMGVGGWADVCGAFVLCSVVVCEDNVSSIHSTKW